jgi:hypothetical protein
MKSRVQRCQTKGAMPARFQLCEACGAKIIWARDDRYPENGNVGELINVEPNANSRGTIVLWYEVTNKMKPIGPQWFRLIDEGLDYRGDRWSRHLETCSKQLGANDVRTV